MAKEGCYQGGIRTVEDLRLRSFVEEDTGCWRWGLATHEGVPKVHVIRDGKRTWMRGRRAALFLARGKDLRRGEMAFSKMCCHNDLCVNPAHARSGTREDHGEWLRKTGKAKTPAKANGAKLLAPTRRKLTEEQVKEIRDSGMSSWAAAKKFGVSQFAAWSVISGKSWKHLLPNASSVFNWRPGV